MKRKNKVILWFLPAISIGILYILSYTIKPGYAWAEYLELIALFLILIWPIATPLLLLKKEKNISVKDILFCVSSIALANLIFIIPELLYSIEGMDLFDEDTVYRTIILITSVLSFIFGWLVFIINKNTR